MHHPTDRIIHTTAFVTPVVEHWLEQEIEQWVHYEGINPKSHHTMSERSYHRATEVNKDMGSSPTVMADWCT